MELSLRFTLIAQYVPLPNCICLQTQLINVPCQGKLNNHAHIRDNYIHVCMYVHVLTCIGTLHLNVFVLLGILLTLSKTVDGLCTTLYNVAPVSLDTGVWTVSSHNVFKHEHSHSCMCNYLPCICSCTGRISTAWSLPKTTDRPPRRQWLPSRLPVWDGDCKGQQPRCGGRCGQETADGVHSEAAASPGGAVCEDPVP